MIPVTSTRGPAMKRHLAIAGLVWPRPAPHLRLHQLAARTVLLGYSAPPTSADSAALQQTFGGVVTIYPLINAMTIRTPLPSARFVNSVPKPGRVTDFDSLRTAAGLSSRDRPGAHVQRRPSEPLRDSGFLRHRDREFRSIYISRHTGLVELDVGAATFPLINRLTATARSSRGTSTSTTSRRTTGQRAITYGAKQAGNL